MYLFRAAVVTFARAGRFFRDVSKRIACEGAAGRNRRVDIARSTSSVCSYGRFERETMTHFRAIGWTEATAGLPFVYLNSHQCCRITVFVAHWMRSRGIMRCGDSRAAPASTVRNAFSRALWAHSCAGTASGCGWISSPRMIIASPGQNTRGEPQCRAIIQPQELSRKTTLEST